MNLICRKMKKIRITNNLTQSELGKKMFVDRTEISRIENGKVPNNEYIKNFSKVFNINEDFLLNSSKIVLPDTSVLIKNPCILDSLIQDFNKVIITQTIIDELDKHKNKKRKNNAWLAMKKINELKDNILLIKDTEDIDINDKKIIKVAKDIENKYDCNVYILHNDIGFNLRYGERSFTLNQYLEQKSSISNYFKLLELDKSYLLDWSNYDLDNINLDSYLEDGQTLLIHTIRSKNKNKYKKLYFLLNNGVDINKTDNYKYYLTPLSHCVQVNDYESFNILLNFGADYNKGSMNESKLTSIKQNNEGNTPLMIAAWHGNFKFIKRLCKYSDLSINQQDSNGYTALMKAVINKHEDIYNYLIKKNADIYIRDRNNHTIEWWRDKYVNK